MMKSNIYNELPLQQRRTLYTQMLVVLNLIIYTNLIF